MYYQKHIPSSRLKRCRRTLAALLLLAVFIAVNAAVHSLVDGLLVSQARIIFNDAVNAAIISTVNNELSAESFVELTRNADGEVTSVETDSQAVNDFRARLGAAIAERLEQYEHGGVEIPLGTLTGLDVLTGRGPCIRLRLIQQGSVHTDLISSFSAAGINQTCHTIDCAVNAEFYAVIPGFRTPVSLDTTVMVAQSVIVGEVPDSFTNVNGDQSDTIGRIFDYGDPYGNDVADNEN